jgi:hypothetical protein
MKLFFDGGGNMGKLYCKYCEGDLECVDIRENFIELKCSKCHSYFPIPIKKDDGKQPIFIVNSNILDEKEEHRMRSF